MMTSAQMTTLSLVTTSAAGSGSTATPAPADASSAAFTGVVRVPGSPNGTPATAVWGPAGIWSPGAVAAATPYVADFTNNGARKGIPVSSSVTAPVAATGTSNGTWYQVAALGTTTNAQWVAAGAANSPAGKVTPGTIFQATGAVAGGSGTVYPLLLATAMSGSSVYQIVSMGTTTQAQWAAAGASGYVNAGTVFTASGAAAAGTGLVMLMASVAGIYLRANNGAAGGASMAFTIDFQEGQ